MKKIEVITEYWDGTLPEIYAEFCKENRTAAISIEAYTHIPPDMPLRVKLEQFECDIRHGSTGEILGKFKFEG
jgi:hypothetical protein